MEHKAPALLGLECQLLIVDEENYQFFVWCWMNIFNGACRLIFACIQTKDGWLYICSQTIATRCSHAEDRVISTTVALNGQEAFKDKTIPIKMYKALKKKKGLGRTVKTQQESGETTKNDRTGRKMQEVLENNQKNFEKYEWPFIPVQIAVYAVPEFIGHNVAQPEENPSASSIWPMRCERLRYASFLHCRRHDDWPSRLAHNGFHFSSETGLISCFLCNNSPPHHQMECQWQFFNVPFSSVVSPPVPFWRILQALGVNERRNRDPPSLDQRMATLRPYYSHHVSRGLAEAGFYADDGGEVTCFSCGLRLERDLVNIGGQLRLFLIPIHRRSSPDCAFIRQIDFPPPPPPPDSL